MKGVLAVVIPAFRCEKTIVATLDSLQTQHRKADIVLVVLDEPNPALEALCRDHAVHPEIIVNPCNLGLAATRNIGFEHVHDRAQYICFFDADDILHPAFFQLACGQLEAMPGVDGVFGRFLEWRGDTPRPELPALAADRVTLLNDALDAYLSNPGGFIHSFGLLRCSSVAAVSPDGKVNVESLRNNEDFEFFARLFFNGTIVRIGDYCGWYRKWPGSQSANQLHAWHFRVTASRLLHDWLRNRGADRSLLRRVRSLEHSAARHLARLHWQNGERTIAMQILLASAAQQEWKSFAQLLALYLGVAPVIRRMQKRRTRASTGQS